MCAFFLLLSAGGGGTVTIDRGREGRRGAGRAVRPPSVCSRKQQNQSAEKMQGSQPWVDGSCARTIDDASGRANVRA